MGYLTFGHPYFGGRDGGIGQRRYAYEKLIELNIIEGNIPLTKEETIEDTTQPTETEFGAEEVIITEEISPEEEQRLKEELNEDQQNDLDVETAEVDILPIDGVDQYYQELLAEEERLRRELDEEDDNCKT
jgi:hypothetical protein